MKAVTWSKDSHGLFDYESRSVQVKKFKIDSSCRICRNIGFGNNPEQENDICIYESKKQMDLDPNIRQLTMINYNFKENIFSINAQQNPPMPAIQNSDEDNENFLIIRSLKNKEGQQKGYLLEPGDIIKLGRMEYAVMELRDPEGRVQTIKDLFCSDAQIIQNIDLTVKPNKECRICFQNEQSTDNPLISPCKCIGSQMYIHLLCLKQWIDYRGQKKQNNNTITFKLKKLDCELCLHPLPKKLIINNVPIDLVTLERPEVPYVILENIQRDKQFSKGLHLIYSPENEPIKMGRGHQCDLRISDISVSRLHAYIKYENGGFVIYDNNSKFGSLVKLIKPIQITTDKIAIQIGRTVLTFVLKQTQGLQQQQVLTGMDALTLHHQLGFIIKKDKNEFSGKKQ